MSFLSEEGAPDLAGRTPSERLARHGLALPEVVRALAAYAPASRSGDLVFTAGQLPIVDGALTCTGKVGAGVSVEHAKDAARVCALNALAAAAAEAGGIDRIEGVVKVVVFVASTPEFTGQPVVADGASELLGEVFGGAGQHARSAVGVAVLPKDAPVEVEIVVRVAHQATVQPAGETLPA